MYLRVPVSVSAQVRVYVRRPACIHSCVYSRIPVFSTTNSFFLATSDLLDLDYTALKEPRKITELKPSAFYEGVSVILT